MGLAENKCVPCRGGVPPMEWAKVQELLYQLKPGWHVSPQGHLERLYTFPDFARALAFANRVGAIAEAEGHHPEITIGWGKCKLEIWTHKIDGLSESDFFLAAKADTALEAMTPPTA
jgi:4a-hydroxytetrahydrobiopterin dehydratase